MTGTQNIKGVTAFRKYVTALCKSLIGLHNSRKGLLFCVTALVKVVTALIPNVIGLQNSLGDT